MKLVRKPTPPPWVVCQFYQDVIRNGEHDSIECDHVTVVIAEGDFAETAEVTGSNRKANARLISHAPAMLDLLKRMSEFAKADQPLHWGALISDDDENDPTVAKELMSLLAKIRGEDR